MAPLVPECVPEDVGLSSSLLEKAFEEYKKHGPGYEADATKHARGLP